jgi:hypothetical protein
VLPLPRCGKFSAIVSLSMLSETFVYSSTSETFIMQSFYIVFHNSHKLSFFLFPLLDNFKSLIFDLPKSLFCLIKSAVKVLLNFLVVIVFFYI